MSTQWSINSEGKKKTMTSVFHLFSGLHLCQKVLSTFKGVSSPQASDQENPSLLNFDSRYNQSDKRGDPSQVALQCLTMCFLEANLSVHCFTVVQVNKYIISTYKSVQYMVTRYVRRITFF